MNVRVPYFVALPVAVAAVLGLTAQAPPPAQAAGNARAAIVNGAIAPPGSWPSQAAILNSDIKDPYEAQLCGGTLIAPNWVLTAAHCVTDDNGAMDQTPANTQVAIGIDNLRNIKASNRLTVESVSVHPGWDRNYIINDYALLKLRKASSQPVARLIAPGEEWATGPGQPAEVAGWGLTSEGGERSADLKEAAIAFDPDSFCADGERYSTDFNPANMICAGGPADACQGDSGGPLMANVSGQRVLAGVVSFGRDCGALGFHGVYSRVSYALGWISAVKALRFSTSGTRPVLTGGSLKVNGQIRVPGAGTVEQHGVAVTRGASPIAYGCNASGELSRAGRYPATCNFGPPGLRALKRSSLKVTVSTTFTRRDGSARTLQDQTFVIPRR